MNLEETHGLFAVCIQGAGAFAATGCTSAGVTPCWWLTFVGAPGVVRTMLLCSIAVPAGTLLTRFDGIIAYVCDSEWSLMIPRVKFGQIITALIETHKEVGPFSGLGTDFPFS